ncbi:MAG: hypothetical protein NZM44_06535, partial [Candidatus Calescibacterium sp.]|nr:hypothetical protein [Candidatus Calescibacterium sp.]
VGIICLSLGLFGLGIISANILGIIFIIFSFILMLLELKFQSYGILTFLGLITFILGSIILFKNVNIYHPLPIGTITLASLTILGLFSYILYAVFSVRKYSSIEQIGKIGRIVKIQGDKLIVNLDGVLWEAIPLNPNTKFENNEEIEIKKVENLILIIDKKQ